MKNEQEIINYDLYSRKSSESEERQVLSISAQVDEMTHLANQTNRHVSNIRPESKSAKHEGIRPVFNQLLKDLEGGVIQGIMAWHPNRLSRNAMDSARLVDLFDRGKLKEIVTPGQTFRNTPSDKFFFMFQCTQAKMENDQKGVDVSRGLKKKAHMGSFPAGCLPEGYDHEKGRNKGDSRIISRPELKLLKRAVQSMLTGKYNPLQIRDMLNNEWGFRSRKGKPLSRSGMYGFFRKTFYYGDFLWNGELCHGTHEKIMTPEEFDKIQFILGKHGKPRSKEHILTFAGGLLRCGECGFGITGEEKIKRQKNGNVHRYIYYHCTKKSEAHKCRQGSIEHKEVIKQINKAIDSIQIPPEFHEFAMKWFRKENEKQFKVINESVDSQEIAYKACIKRLENLAYMRSSGEITPQEYVPLKTKELELKGQLEASRGSTSKNIQHWVETGDQMLTFIENVREKFRIGSYEVKRGILSTLGSDLILKDKKVFIDLEKSLFPMKIVSEESNKIYNKVRTSKKPYTSKELVASYEQSPRLLGD